MGIVRYCQSVSEGCWGVQRTVGNEFSLGLRGWVWKIVAATKAPDEHNLDHIMNSVHLPPGFCQKNPRAHKNKIGTPPPPPKKTPPKKGNFTDMVFPAERTHFFQVSIKLGHQFPAPELRTRILRTRGFF